MDRGAPAAGLVALHGGGEYVTGDEAAMDALVEAGIAARDASPDDAAPDRDAAARPVRVVLVPTAVARHRPDLAVAHGRRAFEAAGRRAGVALDVAAAMILDRAAGGDDAWTRLLDAADVVHLPGGDPDLLPAVLRGTPAWSAIRRAHARGACIAGASAGAMALAERCWTPAGAVDGLGLVPGAAVLPHFDPRRADGWRRSVDPDGRLTWIGLDERTLVIGRPGGEWRVAGAGRAHLLPPGATGVAAAAGHGGTLRIG